MKIEPIVIKISDLNRRGWVRPRGTSSPPACSRHCATLTGLLQAAAPQELFYPLHPAPYIERLQRVIGLVELNHPDANVALIEKAFALAWKGHYSQSRRSREPYIEHPLSVAEILAEWGLDAEEIAAALDHDLSEDARVTKEALQAEINARVALLVDGVTELGKEPEPGPIAPTLAQKYEKFLKLGAKDLAIIVIKLADRLHNMRTLQHMPAEKQKRIALETLDIYVPLADMLGMWQVKRALEDLSFGYVEPELFSRIEERRRTVLAESEPKVLGIVTGIRRYLAGKGLMAETIVERRSIYEISQRMKERKISLGELSSSDVWRINLMTEDRAACYRVLGEVHALFPPIQAEMRDYIAEPRPNGHQFLHTYVEVPGFGRMLVHIRDESMQKNYIYGVTSRQPGDGPWYAGDFVWLKALVESAGAGEVGELFGLVAAVSRQIVVYSHQGKRIELPFGSTVLDFARAIHSDLFLRAKEATVNGRPAPLSQALMDGDQVFIIKDENAEQAKLKWLDWVRTPAAKQILRRFLKKMGRADILRAALDKLDEAAKGHFLPARELVTKRMFIRFISVGKGFRSADDFLYRIGAGEVEAEKFVKEFMEVHHRAVAEQSASPKHYPVMIIAEDRVGLLEDILSPLKAIGISLEQGGFDLFREGDKVKSMIILVAQGVGGEAGEIQRLQIQTIVGKTKGVERVETPPEGKVRERLIAMLSKGMGSRRGLLDWLRGKK